MTSQQIHDDQPPLFADILVTLGLLLACLWLVLDLLLEYAK